VDNQAAIVGWGHNKFSRMDSPGLEDLIAAAAREGLCFNMGGGAVAKLRVHFGTCLLIIVYEREEDQHEVGARLFLHRQ
jgi:hypothetical protein